MAKAARERLARLLAGEEAVAFSAQLSVPSDTLHLEVDGVGQVRLPVRPAQAKKLCGWPGPLTSGIVRRPSSIAAVRDTWEISPDLVSLGGPSWAPALEGALTELADELGVPAGNRLEAELHALLVLQTRAVLRPAPGHREERHDDRHADRDVAVLAHRRRVHRRARRAERHVPFLTSSLSLVAFYADCCARSRRCRPATGRAHVRPAHAGHARDRWPTGRFLSSAGCLAEHFSSPEQIGTGLPAAKQLVYLLDRRYADAACARTAQARDASAATLLRAAADRRTTRPCWRSRRSETWDAEARKITHLIVPHDPRLLVDRRRSRRSPCTCTTPRSAQHRDRGTEALPVEVHRLHGRLGRDEESLVPRAAVVMWTRSVPSPPRPRRLDVGAR